MNRRSATWPASSALGLYVATVVAAFGLVVFGRGTADDLMVALASGYAAVGALVALREPANAIGWLLLAIALGFGLSNLAYAYASNPGLPGVVAVAWVANCSDYVPLYLATMLLPLLFPTGRPISRRWRPAVAAIMIALSLNTVGAAFAEGRLDVRSGVGPMNPLGVGGDLGHVVRAASVTGYAFALIGVVAGAAALVVRLRQARGRERQQVKMLAYVVVAILLDVIALQFGGQISSGPAWDQLVWMTGVLLVGVGLPIAIGIAILRHRLYDIDIVINRTLVYGALTLILAGSYLGLFFLLEKLVLTPITSDSHLAVAGSTLAVAALSRPVRTRIQTAVDRRFYRQRYDASRTLDAFTVRLRDELDLETVAADLQQVARDTMRPTNVSLWLRAAGR